jgi:dipeptidase
METYGYASEGESFSIIDNNEAWVMELIGKGNYEKGAVWVARKIPQGYVSAHANQVQDQDQDRMPIIRLLYHLLSLIDFIFL